MLLILILLSKMIEEYYNPFACEFIYAFLYESKPIKIFNGTEDNIVAEIYTVNDLYNYSKVPTTE